MSEPLSQLLAELPLAEPDAARAERIRMKCRAQLTRQASRTPFWRRAMFLGKGMPVWQPLIAILGIVYMTQVMIQAFGVYGSP